MNLSAFLLLGIACGKSREDTETFAVLHLKPQPETDSIPVLKTLSLNTRLTFV